MKLKFFFAVMCGVILIAGISKSQDDPRWNNPNLVVRAYAEYTALPYEPYVHPVTQPRVTVTPYEVLSAFPNIRVLPNTNQQTEVILCISRNNPTFMFGSSNRTSGSNINSGSYITTNGGTTWFGQDFINNGNSNNQRGDPGPAVGMNNRVIFTHLTSNTNFGSLTGIGAERSTDFGQTFSATVQLVNDGNADKNLAGADDVPASPFFGNFYCAWTSFSSSPANGRFSRTTDGGVTWSAPIILNATPSGHNAQGHDVITRPNGDVVVTWTAGVSSSPFTEDFAGVARSTNGGVSFTVTENAFDCNGSRSPSFNGWSIRTNGFPRIACDKSGGARNGWLYIVVSQLNLAPAGSDADVVMHRSTDGGATWSAGIRVNQDALNNGKVQFFPCVAVDENGGVNVAYYDNRNFPSVGDSATVMISRSLDGGNTWADVEVADHHFRPKPTPGLGGGYMGDYIGIAAGNGKVWAFWMDDKAGPFQAWAGYILSGPPPVNDVVVGPFLSFPAQFVAGTAYNIRARVVNGGTNGQTNLPMRFIVNGVVTATNTIPSLPPSAVDSTTFSWTPTPAGTYTIKIASGAPVDENRLNDTVTATVTVLPQGTINSQTQLCRNGLNIFIPSLGNAAPDSIVVNIPNAFNVVDVNVRLDTVIHTWVSDLQFNLRRGTVNVNFVSGVGGSGDNFIQCKLDDSAATPITSGTAPFTGTWRPTSPLIPFNGQPVNGSWVLLISDLVAGDSGFLRAWCIQVTYQTLVGGIQTTEIPSYYSLAQNYPNPFNPSTTIKFSVPKTTNVALKVYDVLGKEVAVLVNEVKQAGFHTVDFDASHLASGIYFYKIEAGDFNSVKKMILVK